MTHASNERPTRRVVQSRHGELVAELYADRITLRPRGRRRGGPSEVCISLGLTYQQAIQAEADLKLRERRRRRGRGR